ncbi:MAG TPA: GntR family transcriptional regulator [Bradyrhizobium sp.]|nr:GntR family transcriptional regulator [Bradyrhizobium sp.]
MLAHIDPTPDLAEQVYAALLEGICSGELAPGEKFTQEALAARLGVSRQPVLQALLLLRRQGLMVDTENRRGVRVAALDADFVASLYDVRAALDGLAARCAALHPGAALQAAGSEIVRRGRRAAKQSDLKALVGLDLEFHRFLYEASGNGLLLDTAKLHWHHTRRVMTDYLRRGGAPSFRTVWDEHDAILQAIVAGQADAAEQLSRDHAARSVKLLQAGHGAEPAGTATTRPRAASLTASSASARRHRS